MERNDRGNGYPKMSKHILMLPPREFHLMFIRILRFTAPLIVCLAAATQAAPVIYQGPMTNSLGHTRDTCVSIDAATTPLPTVYLWDNVWSYGVITGAWADMNTRKSEIHLVGTHSSILPAYMFKGTFANSRTVLNLQGLSSTGVSFTLVANRQPECTVPPPNP